MAKTTLESLQRGTISNYSMIVSVEKGMMLFQHYIYTFKESIRKKYQPREKQMTMSLKKKTMR